MTNTTTEYWDLHGTSLEQYCWNVQSRAGTLRGTPPPRGSNRTVPHRAGDVYLPKYRGSRVLVFDLWIVGSEADGTPPSSGTRVEKYLSNEKALADLFDFEGQRTLTKRWLEGVTLRSAAAQVEYAGGWEPAMHGPRVGSVAPNLLLADPWFYETGINIVVDGTAKTIRGSHATDKMLITLAAGARVTCAGRWIQNNGAGPMTVDTQERFGTIGGVLSNGLIQRNRLDPKWLELPIGAVTPVATGGSVSIIYYPRWR